MVVVSGVYEGASAAAAAAVKCRTGILSDSRIAKKRERRRRKRRRGGRRRRRGKRGLMKKEEIGDTLGSRGRLNGSRNK